MARPPHTEFCTGMERLQPYLQPDYWDGHSLGIGALNDLEEIAVSAVSLALVRQALETYINDPHPLQIIRQYTSGEVFDPQEYNPGAIFAVQCETLAGSGRQGIHKFISPEVALPVVEPSLPTHKDFRDGTVTVVGYRARRTAAYRREALWGVVASQPSAGSYAILAYNSGISYGEYTTVNEEPAAVVQRRIVIGQTEHLDRPGGQLLYRPLALGVLSMGEASR